MLRSKAILALSSSLGRRIDDDALKHLIHGLPILQPFLRHPAHRSLHRYVQVSRGRNDDEPLWKLSARPVRPIFKAHIGWSETTYIDGCDGRVYIARYEEHQAVEQSQLLCSQPLRRPWGVRGELVVQVFISCHQWVFLYIHTLLTQRDPSHLGHDSPLRRD